MSDLIDRQALLKQIDIDSDGEPGYYGDTWKFIDTIKSMPNVRDFQKDADTISRQAAIDVIDSFNVFESRSDQIKLEQMIGELPPANNSEIPNSSDTISRAKAIEAINKALDRQTLLNRFVRKVAIDAIKQLPHAQLAPDQNGDVWITVPDIDKVTCIYVQESKSKFCRIFYEEKEQPERIVRCKDCKHWIPYDWMFSEVWQSKNMADYPEDEIGCNYCDVAMKANDFCSRAERREVTT